MIQLIGEITDKSSESKKIISTIEKNFKQLKKKTSKRLAYFIWQKPMMSINKTEVYTRYDIQVWVYKCVCR